MISKDDIIKVKETADLVDLITRTGVTLKSSGSNSYKGLCPFHSEKGPSFTVRPSHGTWRCFGCGKSGDAISYIQEQDGMSFIEAVKYVADLYGIHISEDEEDYQGPSRKHLREVMSAAAKYYKDSFSALPEEHPGKLDLRARDLLLYAEESKVGYAPDGWSKTMDHLKGLGFTEDDLLETGLVIKSDKGKVFDSFRGRLTWEIHDISSNVIGFGARKLFESDTGPKYLNTPETSLYHKSSVLYNLDVARSIAAKNNVMYVVEGYTDVMAFRAAGIHNVVASCGTAFGETHASTVRRIVGDSGKIVFCFDGDGAGLAAARKTFALKTPIHAQSTVVVFDSGDPCDIRNKSGNDALLQYLDRQVPLSEFVLKYEIKKYQMSTSEGRSQYLHAVAPLLAEISDPSLREDYMRKTTLWSGSTLNVVENLVRQAIATQNQEASRSQHIEASRVNDEEGEYQEEQPQPKVISELRMRQYHLLALTIQYPDMAWRLYNSLTVPDTIMSDGLRPLFVQVRDLAIKNPDALRDLHPDRSAHPEAMMYFINYKMPMIERLEVNGEITSAQVERMMKQVIKSIESLIRAEEMSAMRASIASTTEDSSDISNLEQIEKNYDRYRR